MHFINKVQSTIYHIKCTLKISNNCEQFEIGNLISLATRLKFKYFTNQLSIDKVMTVKSFWDEGHRGSKEEEGEEATLPLGVVSQVGD